MKKISCGIDIGGINTVIGVVDELGNILEEATISTNEYPYFEDYGTYVSTLSKAIENLIAPFQEDYIIEGVGIGAPNANIHTGTIEQPANLWKYKSEGLEESKRRFNLCDDLNALLPQVPRFVITNDANAATIGEMQYGNAIGVKDFAMITLGTGLGSGFVANGELVSGHDGFAGEMGHMTVVYDGRKCGCGNRGCLECYVSATGIKRTAFELMARESTPSLLRSTTYDNFDSILIYNAAKRGDALALEVFRYTGEILGRALANMATITSPKIIILFGGLAKAGELIVEPTQHYMEANLFPAYKGKIKIMQSSLQDKNIAVIGAAALIFA